MLVLSFLIYSEYCESGFYPALYLPSHSSRFFMRSLHLYLTWGCLRGCCPEWAGGVPHRGIVGSSVCPGWDGIMVARPPSVDS